MSAKAMARAAASPKLLPLRERSAGDVVVCQVNRWRRVRSPVVRQRNAKPIDCSGHRWTPVDGRSGQRNCRKLAGTQCPCPTVASLSGGGGIRTLEGPVTPNGFRDRRIRPLCHPSSGEGGIRTLEGAVQPLNALAGRRLQPLGHFSVRRMVTSGLPAPDATKPVSGVVGAARTETGVRQSPGYVRGEPAGRMFLQGRGGRAPTKGDQSWTRAISWPRLMILTETPPRRTS